MYVVWARGETWVRVQKRILCRGGASDSGQSFSGLQREPPVSIDRARKAHPARRRACALCATAHHFVRGPKRAAGMPARLPLGRSGGGKPARCAEGKRKIRFALHACRHACATGRRHDRRARKSGRTGSEWRAGVQPTHKWAAVFVERGHALQHVSAAYWHVVQASFGTKVKQSLGVCVWGGGGLLFLACLSNQWPPSKAENFAR